MWSHWPRFHPKRFETSERSYHGGNKVRPTWTWIPDFETAMPMTVKKQIFVKENLRCGPIAHNDFILLFIITISLRKKTHTRNEEKFTRLRDGSRVARFCSGNYPEFLRLRLRQNRTGHNQTMIWFSMIIKFVISSLSSIMLTRFLMRFGCKLKAVHPQLGRAIDSNLSLFDQVWKLQSIFQLDGKDNSCGDLSIEFLMSPSINTASKTVRKATYGFDVEMIPVPHQQIF